ncbi:MAG: hypothetical protein LBB98_08200 [Treponema sp.]|jgi:hypothetical protein|nr:hypothetical protein [Treponema sp.]
MEQANAAFCYMLTVTDVATRWTEERVLKNKAHRWVREAMDDVYASFLIVYLESVHNVDTLWTDHLETRIFAAFRRENARSVRKVTDFVDRHYLLQK